jgi:recombination protein RecT
MRQAILRALGRLPVSRMTHHHHQENRHMATNLQDIKADQQAGTNELARRAAHPITGKTDYLDKRKDLLGAGIPGHMTVEREIRTATVMLMQSKDLQAATPLSFYVAVSIAINSGIGLGNGKGYLVAYKGNVSYVPGWKGLIDLVNRTGRASAWTGVVRKGDHFAYQLGDSPFLEHRPGDSEEHADITHYYAIGRVKGAEFPHVVVWSVAKVIKHLNQYNKVGGKHYAAKNDDNIEAYGRKVVLLQVIKYLPTSVELENAVAAENASASGKAAHVENTIDGNFVFIDEEDADQGDQDQEEHPRTDAPAAAAATEEKPSANQRRAADAETVEVREAQPAAASATSSGTSASKPGALTPEASEQYERLMAQLHRAGNLNQLADVYELVGEVENTELRGALNKLYQQRLAEMTPRDNPGPGQEEKPTAPTKRTRGARGAAPE